MPNDRTNENQGETTTSNNPVQDSNAVEQLQEQIEASETEEENQLSIVIENQTKIIELLEAEKADRTKELESLKKIEKSNLDNQTATNKIDSTLTDVIASNQKVYGEKFSDLNDQLDENIPMIVDQAKAGNTNLETIDSSVATIAVSADPINETNTISFLADGAILFMILGILPCYFIYRVLKSQFALLNHIY